MVHCSVVGCKSDSERKIQVLSSQATEALEKQLESLQIIRDPGSNGKIKKIPPAVPPKKRGQPQVPHSAVVNTLREPSYSTKISPVFNNNHPRYDVITSGETLRPSDNYANVSHQNIPTSKTYPYKKNLIMQSKNSNPTYCNISSYQNNFNNISLPPPPLPPPSVLHMCKEAYDRNHNNNEEYLPPPSPVSSNYSELARAASNLHYNPDRAAYTHIYQNDYPAYGNPHSSTYESIYEPVNPRPHSSLSTNSNNSMHSYRNMSGSGSAKSPLPKEEEVDTLTDLLVQSISDGQDPDIFGICIKCNGKVVGENSGCTAMGDLYHVKCFCCHKCGVNLQGKPFYAVEGHPHCESDYYATLEKCSVCNKPILDRILRATGKPYHPACFTCVVCGISLDGIPFTVDALNQIHCIDDFHKKFAPRCCVCELPIMPEEGEEETVRVVALDRSFHVRCYRCEDCGMLLSSEAEGRGCYPLDNHILCKACNGHRVRQLTNNTNVMTTDL